MKRELAAVFTSYIAVLLYHTRSFLFTSEFGGRDLIGAYSLLEVFGSSWRTEWFLGFPLFRFYPPGFFAVADTLGVVLGESLAFRLLVYLPLLVFPFTVYICFREVFDDRTGLVAFILSFAVVFLREPLSLVYQTLQVGLVAQMAALPLLMLYIGSLWSERDGSTYLTGLLLASLILVHPYIAAVAVLYTAFYMFFEDLTPLPGAILGFLLTAWWWIPVLEKSWYMQLYTGPTGKLLNWPWVFLPLALLDRSREAMSFLLTALILLVAGTFDFGFNLQFYRFYIYGQFMMILAAAPGLNRAISILGERIDPRATLVLISLAFLAPSIAVDVSPDWRSDVELQGVVPEEGRMIVETSHSDVYNSYVPIQRIPLESNVTVVNGLYADQSISSPYLLGLEKSFAENPVPNPIAVDANLTSEQLKERFRYFGIDYALVRSEHAERKLSFMQPVSSNEDFVLLKHNYSRPDYEPVVVKGNYKEWEELNRRIFRSDLRPVMYESAYSSRNSSRESIQILNESINPESKRQALFGLKTD